MIEQIDVNRAPEPVIKDTPLEWAMFGLITGVVFGLDQAEKFHRWVTGGPRIVEKLIARAAKRNGTVILDGEEIYPLRGSWTQRGRPIRTEL